MTDKAGKLFDNLIAGKEIHESFAKLLKERFTINGKTMDEWREFFHVDTISIDLNPENCRKLSGKVADLYQEASFLKAVASAKLQMLEKSSDTSYRERYTALFEKYRQEKGKNPAAATLDTLAKFEQDDVYSAVSMAKVAKAFWTDILGGLHECRKTIETSTFNNNIEARMEAMNRGDE
jgi:hypothetical protein